MWLITWSLKSEPYTRGCTRDKRRKEGATRQRKNPVGKHCSTRNCNAKFATCFRKASRLARPVTRLASLRLPITHGLRKAKRDARRIANLLRTPHAPEAKRASRSLRKSAYQTTGAHTHGCCRTVGRRNFPRAASCNRGRRSTRAHKHSKTESSKSRRSFRKFITSTHSAGNWKQKREM